jgi:hypothetical protein
MPLASSLPIAPPQSHRPILESFDSGEECSFEHWQQVCVLVDQGDVLEIEETIEERFQKWSPPPQISTSPVT